GAGTARATGPATHRPPRRPSTHRPRTSTRPAPPGPTMAPAQRQPLEPAQVHKWRPPDDDRSTRRGFTAYMTARPRRFGWGGVRGDAIWGAGGTEDCDPGAAPAPGDPLGELDDGGGRTLRRDRE